MSEPWYVFVTNGNDSECDGKDGEYRSMPVRPHPNCRCKILEKRRDRGCVTMELQLDGVDFDPPIPPDPGGPVGPGTDDPDNPKIVIDGLPPGTEIRPPLEWWQIEPCVTFHYRITCVNGWVEGGLIRKCLEDPDVELDDYEAWEKIVCPFLLEQAEAEAWIEVEAAADAALSRGECACHA